jgi:hypothetical protein
MYIFLFFLPALSDGLGMGLKSLVLPVPKVLPLGVTAISDSAPSNNTSSSYQLPVVSMPKPEDETWMINFEFVIKILAITSNIILQLSPLKPVTTGTAMSPIPLLAIAACGYQWSFYGYFAYTVTGNVGFLFLIHSNILGLILGMYYIWIYSRTHSVTTLWKLSVSLVLIFCMEFIYTMNLEDSTQVSKALEICGLLSAAVSIVVSASPMVSIKQAILEKSIQCLPTDMIAASTVSNCLWLVFGYLLSDSWVLIPNSVGLVFSMIQISVIGYIWTLTSKSSTAKRLHRMGNQVYRWFFEDVRILIRLVDNK